MTTGHGARFVFRQLAGVGKTQMSGSYVIVFGPGNQQKREGGKENKGDPDRSGDAGLSRER